MSGQTARSSATNVRPDLAPRVVRSRSPLAITVPAAVGVAFLALPLVMLAARAPWTRLPELWGSEMAREAARLSVVTATCSALLCVVLGVPIAWVLTRSRTRLRSVIRALVILPLVLPPVVGGAALLLSFGRTSAVGSWLFDWFGVQLPFSTAGVVMAETFVALPFLVITVEGALLARRPDYEEAAAGLGASRLTVIRRVTLPLVGPAIAAGFILSWARALGEFGATITFAGNFPGTTQTLPLAVYTALESDKEAAFALSALLLLICLAVLALLHRYFIRGLHDEG